MRDRKIKVIVIPNQLFSMFFIFLMIRNILHVKKIREEKYDLVLLDLVMPGINGIDVLKFLNDNKINIPVIMVSGVRDEKVIKNTIELGAKDYIPKPIDLEKLENSIFFHVRKNQFGSGNRCQQ